jgi:integrase
MTAANRPKKGDKITVEPIRKQKDVEAIKAILQAKPRDYLLFVIGINNGLRAGDLLKLKVKEVKGKKVGTSIQIKEGKTGKINVLVINNAVYKAIQKYMKARGPDDQDYLFKSRKGINKPITIQAVNNYIKKWCKTINLKGNYGAHTLRKTWGYHARMYHGAGFELICKRFNHRDPSVTMRYLRIEDKEIHNLLMCNV